MTGKILLTLNHHRLKRNSPESSMKKNKRLLSINLEVKDRTSLHFPGSNESLRSGL